MLTPWRGGEFRYRVWLLLTSPHPQPLSKGPGNPKQLGPPGMRLCFFSVLRTGTPRAPTPPPHPHDHPNARLCLLWGKFPSLAPESASCTSQALQTFLDHIAPSAVTTGDLLSALIMNLREQGGAGRSEVLAPFPALLPQEN